MEVMTAPSASRRMQERVGSLRKQYPGPMFVIHDADHSADNVTLELQVMHVPLRALDWRRGLGSQARESWRFYAVGLGMKVDALWGEGRVWARALLCKSMIALARPRQRGRVIRVTAADQRAIQMVAPLLQNDDYVIVEDTNLVSPSRCRPIVHIKIGVGGALLSRFVWLCVCRVLCAVACVRAFSRPFSRPTACSPLARSLALIHKPQPSPMGAPALSLSRARGGFAEMGLSHSLIHPLSSLVVSLCGSAEGRHKGGAQMMPGRGTGQGRRRRGIKVRNVCTAHLTNVYSPSQ